MSDLNTLFIRRDQTWRWRAEKENAAARVELALMRERMAFLISQSEPLNTLDVDREKVRVVCHYIETGRMP